MSTVDPRRKSSIIPKLDAVEARKKFRARLLRTSQSFEDLQRSSVSLYRSSAKSLGIPEKTDPPPNGGWGWVVVISAFLIHLNVLGLQYSFGVIYKALRDDPTIGGESRAAAAVTGSIASALMLLFSLPAGILVKRFGPRPVSASGAILISVGLWLSSMTSDLRVLYVTYGVISGIGYGICWSPSVMAVNMYFTSRRALASGVAVAGSGVGTVVYANVCNHLVEELGWRGALFQLALISGVCNLLSALSFFPVGKDKGDELQTAKDSTGNLAAKVEKGEMALLSADGLAAVRDVEVVSDTAPTGDEVAATQPEHEEAAEKGAIVLPRRPSPAVLEEACGSGCGVAPPLISPSPSLSVGSDTARNDHAQIQRGVSATQAAPTDDERSPAPMTLWALLQERAMVIIAVTMFAYAGSIWIPYTFLVAYAQSEGGMAAEKAANLVATIGLASTVGRVLIGAVSDTLGIRRLLQASMLLTGASLVGLAMLPPAHHILVGFAIVFGAFAGSVVAMIGPLLVEQLGIRNLPTAFGLAAALQAPAVVLGPPLGGVLRDTTGAYMWTWMLPGAVLCLVSFGLVLLPRSARA